MEGVNATVISFHTPGGDYAKYAQGIASKCYRLGIQCYIEKRDDVGGYLANCRQKPMFILETLQRLKTPVLWIDADAELRKDPRGALLVDVDFMAGIMPPQRQRHWHVGTLFFNNTAQAKKLLRLWIKMLDNETSDEAALDRVRCSSKWHGKFAALPASYHWCRGKVWLAKDNQHIRDSTVILHNLSTSQSKNEALAAARARSRRDPEPLL